MVKRKMKTRSFPRKTVCLSPYLFVNILQQHISPLSFFFIYIILKAHQYVYREKNSNKTKQEKKLECKLKRINVILHGKKDEVFATLYINMQVKILFLQLRQKICFFLPTRVLFTLRVKVYRCNGCRQPKESDNMCTEAEMAVTRIFHDRY
jgi:hypothetical protein